MSSCSVGCGGNLSPFSPLTFGLVQQPVAGTATAADQTCFSFFFGCQCSSIKLASNSCLVDEMQMLQHLCLFWWYLYLKAVRYIKVWLSGQESNFLKKQVAVAGLGDVSVADRVAGRNDCVLTTHFSPRCRGKKVQTVSYQILGRFSACLSTKINVYFRNWMCISRYLV